MRELRKQSVQKPQGRIILQSEPYRIEQCDLLVRAPARRCAAEHLRELGYREIRRELLDLSFDPGLRFVLDKDTTVRPGENVTLKLCFSRTIAAYRIQVHPAGDHAVFHNDGIAL